MPSLKNVNNITLVSLQTNKPLIRRNIIMILNKARDRKLKGKDLYQVWETLKKLCEFSTGQIGLIWAVLKLPSKS
jgi:hypothetical protein